MPSLQAVPSVNLQAAAPTDEALLRDHLAGGEDAFRDLMERHQHWVHSYLAARTRSADVAADLFQEVFLRVARGAPAFRFRARFSTWLFTITSNVLRKHLARERVRRTWMVVTTPLRRAGAEGADVDPLEAVPDPHAAADFEVDARRRAERLRSAIFHLPEHERTVLLLVNTEGLPLEEVAVMLSTNVNTIKTRLRRARLRLLALMGEGSRT
jgi:RNA polymerase sigma-70 factor (ECF subfamily)